MCWHSDAQDAQLRENRLHVPKSGFVGTGRAYQNDVQCQIQHQNVRK